MKKLAKVLSLTLTLVMYAVILTACSISVDVIKMKYENAGFEVEVKDSEDLEKMSTDLCGREDALEWAFKATRRNDKVYVVYFKDTKTAEFVESVLPIANRFRVKRDGKLLFYAPYNA